MNRQQRRHPDQYTDQGYVKRIMQGYADGVIPVRPGEMGHLLIYHDNWCRLLAGTGYCNCAPIIKYAKHVPEGWPS